MGGAEQLVRAAGVLAGLGLAVAAAAPFTGVPPRGRSGALAPAQIEVRVLASGEFTVEPLGTVLKAAPFPRPGERGGPTMAVSLRNITGKPLRVSVRLVPIAASLDDAATLRGSAGGAVVLRGALARAGAWTAPQGLVASGATTTLRIRFKLRKGLDPDQFLGRLDIRELQVKGTPPGQALDVPSDAPTIVPGTEGTTPALTPLPSPPAPAATPAAPSRVTPAPTNPGSGPGAPRRRAPDEGAE